MKFRLVLILALLLGVAALSGLTATMRVHVVGPLQSPTAYGRIYYQGDDPPHLTEFQLPSAGQTVEVDFELADWSSTSVLIAELYNYDDFYSQSGTTSDPVFDFWLPFIR